MDHGLVLSMRLVVIIDLAKGGSDGMDIGFI